MKTLKKLLSAFLIFIICSVFVFAKAGDVMYVAVQKGKLKEKNSSFSKTILQLDYAQKVKIVKEEKKWSFIQSESDKNIQGWIVSSALTKRKIIKNSLTTADAKELALAGKGFTEALEKEIFKNTENNLALIDKIEKNQISEEKIVEFIKEGNLHEE